MEKRICRGLARVRKWMRTGNPTAAKPASSQISKGGPVHSSEVSPSSLSLQEAIPQKPVGFVRRFRQEPVTSARLAARLDLPQKSIKSLPIKRADHVGFSIEMPATTFGLQKTRGGQRGQIQFFRMDYLEKNDVEPRASK